MFLQVAFFMDSKPSQTYLKLPISVKHYERFKIISTQKTFTHSTRLLTMQNRATCEERFFKLITFLFWNFLCYVFWTFIIFCAIKFHIGHRSSFLHLIQPVYNTAEFFYVCVAESCKSIGCYFASSSTAAIY